MVPTITEVVAEEEDVEECPVKIMHQMMSTNLQIVVEVREIEGEVDHNKVKNVRYNATIVTSTDITATSVDIPLNDRK